MAGDLSIVASNLASTLITSGVEPLPRGAQLAASAERAVKVYNAVLAELMKREKEK